MSVIAIAGGTGNLGRAIVDALVAEGQTVFILAREVSETKERELGAHILAVDYNDAKALAELLQDNKVEVVISALSKQAGLAPELALIKAAETSSTTKRFIPSIWGIEITPHIASYFRTSGYKVDVIKTLEASSLQWTAIHCGYFLDFFVAPKVKTYLNPMALVVDPAHNAAAIPGSGDVPVLFIHTFDLARFIGPLLKQSEWRKETYIIGDKVTWHQFLAYAEEAKGAKFTVAYDSFDKLKAGQITELPSHKFLYSFFPKKALQGMFSAFGRMFEEGAFDLKPSHTMNQDFPEIKTRTVRELVMEAWKV